MARRNRAYTHRHDEAQPVNHHSDRDPVSESACAERRTKEAARYRQREYAALASAVGKRAGPGIGDQQGKVA